MTCDVIGSMLVDHLGIPKIAGASAPIPAGAVEHLKGCASCRELIRTLDTAERHVLPSGGALEGLAENLSAGLIPVKPLAPERFYLLGFAGAFAATAIFGAYH